jgi:hypothetical protein
MSRPFQERAEATARQAGQSTRSRCQGLVADDYESPMVVVIGSIRDLTGGSAASGKKDANSQYYW